MSNTIISLFKIHINRYINTILGLSGLMIVLMLVSVSIQVYANNPVIVFGVEGMGILFALLALVIFTRGRNGEGKFLSRLPVSHLQVFGVKLIVGVLVFLSIMALFLTVAAVIVGLLKIVGYQVTADRLFDVSVLAKTFVHFFKGYLWYMFLVCLVLFLERWMSAGEAIGMVIIVPILLMILFPLLFKMLNININFETLDYSFIKSIFQFIKANKDILVTIFYILLTALSSSLYRLRGFKSF